MRRSLLLLATLAVSFLLTDLATAQTFTPRLLLLKNQGTSLGYVSQMNCTTGMTCSISGTRVGTVAANGTVTNAVWTSTSNFDAAAASEGVAFLGPYRIKAARTTYFGDVACNWDFAGTGGTTGVVAEVYDLTAGAQVCACTLGACTTAALTPVTCACNTSYAPSVASTVVVRLTSGTDCTANPQRVVCTVALQPSS